MSVDNEEPEEEHEEKEEKEDYEKEEEEKEDEEREEEIVFAVHHRKELIELIRSKLA